MMKNVTSSISVALIAVLLFTKCDNSSEKNIDNRSVSTGKEEKAKKEDVVDVSGIYSGRDNVGMVSTIIINSDGTYAIKASVGPDRLNHGVWKEAYRYGRGKIDLYMDDDLGGGLKKWASATITQDGLKIDGGKFYARK